MPLESKLEISEKEFAVIREISNNHLPDQRTIATRTGISLGLTNLIIKRLIKQGHIKAKQLSKKKIQYLLTPKGFTEKANKSYNYTLKTIGLLKSVKEGIQSLVMESYDSGVREFVISGSSDLSDITEIVFNNLALKDAVFTRQKNDTVGQGNAHLILKSAQGDKTVNMIEYISNKGLNYWW